MLVDELVEHIYKRPMLRRDLLAMVAHDDDLIGDGSIDDSDNIPVGRDGVVLLVVQVEDDVLGRGTNVVVDALVSETKVSSPVFVEVLGLRADAVEGLQDGKSILVGDGDRGDAGNVRLSRATRNAGLGRVAWGSAARRLVLFAVRYSIILYSTGPTHGSPGAKLRNWVLPRCTLLGWRAGPAGYFSKPFSSVTSPSSPGSV